MVFDDSNGDDGVDPYDGDPCNEVADIATSFGFSEREVNGEDWGSAEYHDAEVSLTVDGPISRVLPILRAAHGR